MGVRIIAKTKVNNVPELNLPPYEINTNIAVPKGADPSKIQSGQITNSFANKLHLIKLADDFPFKDDNLSSNDKFKIKSFSDLCLLDGGAVQYDPDDFLYCKNLGYPLNRLITLRRFPLPCTDNIWDKEIQKEPDIARLVTYFDQNTNKLDELLAFTYKLKWKELTSEFEQASMQGEQTGLSGFMLKAMKVLDPNLYNNDLRGENANMLDPKHDQNRVYGPVDSITNTHIRDVGFEFNKDFEVQFDYELRSWSGRTPEYAMKDIISNVLATTYNNGKFWPGARYWVGQRPSRFTEHFQYMNTDDMDKILSGAYNDLKSVLHTFGNKSSAIDTLKNALKGGIALGMGKILDKVGRPGILAMNSLLSGEPTGFWHLSIGNPLNPILSIGNLICEDVSFSFPTDSLSYGEFPTKLTVKIKLKPAQIKDRAGIEMMFNMGKERIYYAPKSVDVAANKVISKTAKGFFGFDTSAVDFALGEVYDFVADGVKSVSKTIQEVNTNSTTEQTEDNPSSSNNNEMNSNSEL
jgi:hypothetical protein